MADLNSGAAFSRRDLLVILAVVGCLMALLAQGVFHAMEAQRRVQCTSYLKQMGLAVQNYHDLRRETPPAYLTTDEVNGLPTGHCAWTVLILPYAEQLGEYRAWTRDSSQPNANLVANQAVAANGRSPAETPPWAFCPTRGPNGRRNQFGGVPNVIGARGDYAAVAYGEARTPFTASQLAMTSRETHNLTGNNIVLRDVTFRENHHGGLNNSE